MNRHNIYTLCFCALLAAGVAPAQETWRGLRFGMSQDAASQALPPRLQTWNQPGILRYAVDLLGCKADAALSFPEDRLGSIRLAIDELVGDCKVSTIYRALELRYGRPLSFKNSSSIEAVWRHEGQAITLFAIIAPRAGGVCTVTYEPIPADL